MAAENRVKVWDPLVRVFHWALVAAFGIAYFSEDDFLLLHSWAGYIVFALLLVRLVWGFLGTRYARFSNFIYSPREIRQFLKQTLRLRAKRYIGHNPAGGAMIVLLIISLLITTITGMAVYGISDNAGPLATWLSNSGHATEEAFEEVHEFLPTSPCCWSLSMWPGSLWKACSTVKTWFAPCSTVTNGRQRASLLVRNSYEQAYCYNHPVAWLATTGLTAARRTCR